MTKKHDAVFDDVLSGLNSPQGSAKKQDKGGARFLKRSTSLGERLSGEREEKTLLWVDPAECIMWEHHNRRYELLNEENCADLIEGIRAQGRQEFPAIVRKLEGQGAYKYEVICGARRHWSVSWLRANNYPQYKFLIETRDLTNEEAFRLSDIENRDRTDISDYERAVDYARAIDLFYGGKQKAMAQRLEVSEVWLSRYLNLAALPPDIVNAYYDVTHIRELHARTLKPLLANPKTRKQVLTVAAELAERQQQSRAGQGGVIDGPQVISLLKAEVARPRAKPKTAEYIGAKAKQGIKVAQKGRGATITVPETINKTDLRAALDAFLDDRE